MNDPETASFRNEHARVAGVIALAAASLGLVLLLTSHHHHTAGRTAAAPAHSSPSTRQTGADVTIRAQAPLMPIPRSFLGLSTEYWTLPVDERHIALYTRVMSLLHVPGDGRFVLRIGGDSSDHTFYDPRVRKLPRWAFELTPAFIARTSKIVKEMRLRVILDLNLVTSTPLLAAAWAREAEAQLPKGSIIGFEIGNEPDLYDRSFWFFATGGERFLARALPSDITPRSYASDFNVYARLLAKVAPGVPLLAPALANPGHDANWIARLLASPHPGLREISGHRYPYSACAFQGSPLFPTIDRVLSDHATAGMARSLRPAIRLAHDAGLPFRLTEFNSVTCGGLAGVSNAYATALWAPDAAFELARAGIQGINLHARVFSINDPFTFDRRGLVARPLLYGLILFARTLGPNARLTPLQVSGVGTAHLKAWAVRVGSDTLHLLLIDKGRTSEPVTLHIPAAGTATAQQLLGPSPGATTGETLAGQRLDQNGIWIGKAVTEAIPQRGGRYTLTLRPYSATLLSVRTASGALT